MKGTEFSVTNLKEKLLSYQTLFPQVSTLLRLLLTMPATSVSGLFLYYVTLRLNYLRTTMKQERWNHLMMIYIHKDKKIDMMETIKEFIQYKENKLSIFENFGN